MQRSLPLLPISSFALLFCLAGLLAACRPLAAPDAGAPAVTPARVVAPVVAPDAAGDWQRIREAGRIVVGTAADFPPFAYYDDTFRLAGYDPALLEALGQQLGLEVVFKDFAFEGLPAALALGQIDVAAAALTVTPERSAMLDFTQPYFATSEGFLAPPDAAGSIAALDDLAGRRIGIERGSVYESWLRRELVGAGLSAESDLLLYATVEAAAADLDEGRIDLLVTDLPAAQQLARQHGLSLAGQGLLAQQYALALRQGAGELRGQLDAALAVLAQNGALARLAQAHLGLDRTQLLPPGQLPAEAAAEAASDAVAPAGSAACTNGLAWLEDRSLPDQGMTTPAVMAPAQSFAKAWRVLNTGTCTWDSSYKLVFAHGSAPGASMGGLPVHAPAAAPPGASLVLTATLAAPITAGVYQGSWQMQDSAGHAFGERLRVGIQVAAVPTPTPGPTQTPVAGILFAADAERVRQGNPVTLRWEVADADEVYFYRAGQSWASHAVAAQGEAADIPGATTTYQLRVVRAGQVEDRLLTVYVEPDPALPQIAHFVLSSPGELAVGACVTVTWRIEGEVEQVALFRNKETLWEAAPLEGAFADCPPAEGEYEYAIGAQGPGGRNYAVTTLRVVSSTTAPAATPGPLIERFTVLPESLVLGGCARVEWAVSGDTANIQVRRDAVVLLDGAPATGSGSDCPSATGLRRYRLVATDAQGQASEYRVAVEVVAPAPSPAPSPAPPAAADSATAPAAPALTAPEQATPAGHEHLLIAYRSTSGELVSPLTGTQITLALAADGALSGNGGCNRYSSRFQLEEGTLAIEPLVAGKMFCAEPIGLMDQEAQYLNLLPQAAAWLLEAGQLTLLDGAGNPLAVYITVQ